MATSSAVHSVITAAGIDIGFFSTKFTLGQHTGQSGTEIVADQFPSLAPKSPQKTLPILAHSSALDAVIINVDNVDYCVGKSVLSMGGPSGSVRAASENFCQTPAYKALLLGAFYYMAKHHGGTGSLLIKHLTLGLPLNTVFAHAEFVKQMAEGEHVIPCPNQPDKKMKVFVQNVIVVAQPQGAMVNYTSGLMRKIKSEDQALVLDMGGGTFDWFICNGDFLPDYFLCGAAPIGALACSSAICERIKPGLKSQPRTLDKVDRALRNGDPTVQITGVDYTMADYWPIVASLIEESLEQMRLQVGKLDDMDHILLTGGGAGILQKVAERSLSDYRLITVMDRDPVFSNVKGFHRIAQMIGGVES